MTADTLYEPDFHPWALDQAVKIRAGGYRLRECIVAEEIESLARERRRQFEHCLAVLMAHRLKWDFQMHDHERTRKRLAQIAWQQFHIADHLKHSPSLKLLIPKAMVNAYGIACIFASADSSVVQEDFPVRCPYSFADLMELPPHD